MQMSEGTSQLLYKGGRAGRPAAGRPGGAGRPAAGRPGGPVARQPGDRSKGPVCNYFSCFFYEKAPAARLPGSQVPATRLLGGRGIFL